MLACSGGEIQTGSVTHPKVFPSLVAACDAGDRACVGESNCPWWAGLSAHVVERSVRGWRRRRAPA
ncbi:MAG TPA: hypothetical protein PLU30_07720 [Verrucomicrobiae bacterium]|nr:hypothetical protein [Verrucomicrobiae bacterium]